MIGGIIGDIAGSVLEVKEIEALGRKEKVSYEERISILNRTKKILTLDKTFTDDTILMVSLMEALLNDKNYDKYLRSYGEKYLNMGLDKFGRSRFGKGFCDFVLNKGTTHSYGNGSATRIGPFGYYFDNYEDTLIEIEKATKPSHDNPESYRGAKAIGSIIYLSREGFTKKQIKSFIEKIYYYDLNYDMDTLQRNNRFSVKTSTCVPISIFCFLEGNDFEDVIRKSLSVGGDADTIACISGVMAEAYYDINPDLIDEAISYLDDDLISVIYKFYDKIGRSYVRKKQKNY